MKNSYRAYCYVVAVELLLVPILLRNGSKQVYNINKVFNTDTTCGNT